MANDRLPGYITAAKPVPLGARAPWYKSTAPTYAGIMLWFVFWQDVPTGGLSEPVAGGILSSGLGTALLGLVAAALICHFLFYLVPGLLGMKSGLPLYVVGTSTYGAQGGFLMPGFLMGLLQFGWLGVNAFFASCVIWGENPFGETIPIHVKITMAVWTLLAAFVGLKGIKYVASVATYLPLIPLVILLILLVQTIGNVGSFDADALVKAGTDAGHAAPLSAFGVVALSITYVVGFFATAGAAGVDFGMNNPDAKHVQMGGLVGIAGATIVAGALSLLVAAGGYAESSPLTLQTASPGFMAGVTSEGTARVFGVLLAIAAFPPACFSSFIAANSFKTTLPNVNPFASVGAGAVISIILAVTGWAGDVINVFKVIGASFGPVCGAMLVDYLLAGRKWPGPRAGFNPAGWISWAVGFAVGMLDILEVISVPAAPVVAFVIGAVLYFVLASAGLQSKQLSLEPAPEGEGEGEGGG